MLEDKNETYYRSATFLLEPNQEQETAYELNVPAEAEIGKTYEGKIKEN